MRDDMVALDLETTGLDARRDRIIEIAAVRFNGDGIIEEFDTLIDPGHAIPWHISQLTGIYDYDVSGAAVIEEVIPGLREFIGSSPVLGHSVQFDLGFLEANGLTIQSPATDTYAVASTLLPHAPSYSLSSLIAQLSLDSNEAHRALNDVLMTIELYKALWNKALDLPPRLVAEIVDLGRMVDWGAHSFYQAILEEMLAAEQGNDGTGQLPDVEDELVDHFLQDGDQDYSGPELRPGWQSIPLDVDALSQIFQPDNALSKAFDYYQYRPQQVSMLTAVAQAFNRGEHVFIEAPTGVGKSMAYLVPAAHFAVTNNTRVVISTNTIALQDQIVLKDSPVLKEALDLPVRVAVFKGRANYLCPRRMGSLRRRGPTSPEELLVLTRILIWLTTNSSGDRSDISLRGSVESAIWDRLSARDEGCTLGRCASQFAGACPFYQARKKADAAHLLIVNHALLLSDVSTEGRILPEFRYLVVDEAHHLEDALTHSLSFRADPRVIDRLLNDLGNPSSGILGEVLEHTRGSVPQGYFSTLESFIGSVTEAKSYLSQHIEGMFQLFADLARQQSSGGQSEYTQQIRIVDKHRNLAIWEKISRQWDILRQFTSVIAESTTALRGGLEDLSEYDIDNYEDILSSVTSAARHLNELHDNLGEVVDHPAQNTIYWLEVQPDGQRLSLNAAPLHVGTMMQEQLWFTKETIIMTSATLQANNSFAHIQTRLGAEDSQTLIIDSPFNYEETTLLYLPDDIPLPNEREEYQGAVEEAILRLSIATEGRLLALFTSYSQLQQTSRAIGPLLTQNDIQLFDQGVGVSRRQLIEAFVNTSKGVLFGTQSFWEGVDIPGEDLSALVIVRLPFNVPSDPIFAARSEQYQNNFLEYAVPEAIIRFRQGFGRLIRRESDRGVVTILDSRITQKAYGRHFVEALPSCAVRRGSIDQLPSAAVRWLNSG